MQAYIIRDALGRIVGRPKGYPTVRSVNRAIAQFRRKLWTIYYEQENKPALSNIVYSMKLESIE